jgi:hypothetical protein
MQREAHYLGGSTLLWSILCSNTWEPKDVDFFALTRRSKEDWGETGCHMPSMQEYHHLTPFVHDLFDFKRPFLTDEQQMRLASVHHQQQSPRAKHEEKLYCVEPRDGYILFPLYARTYETRDTHALFDYILVQDGMDQGTHCWFPSCITSSLADLIIQYAGLRTGYSSVQAMFQAVRDMGFCQVLFDGQRLHVEDWESIWTRSSVVDMDNIRLPQPTHENRMKLWARTLHRVSKYRDRGFNVTLIGDTRCFFQKYEDDERCIARRHSLASTRGFPFPNVPRFQAHEGILVEDVNSRTCREYGCCGSWRPTARLMREQKAREHKTTIVKDNEMPDYFTVLSRLPLKKRQNSLLLTRKERDTNPIIMSEDFFRWNEDELDL